jgi:transposase
MSTWTDESLLYKDLRQKIVDAIERGMPKAQAARTFGVGISTVKRYATKAQRGEPLEPGKAPGERPKMDGREGGREAPRRGPKGAPVRHPPAVL